MSSFTHGTVLLPPSSFPSYHERIMSMCKAVRDGEVGTPFPMLYMCSGFSAASLGWSHLSVRSALAFMSLNILMSLTSRVGRISMNHAACKSVLVRRVDCLEAWCLTAGKEGTRHAWSKEYLLLGWYAGEQCSGRKFMRLEKRSIIRKQRQIIMLMN